MRIPRYWAKGPAMTMTPPGMDSPVPVSCWGWSDVSRSDAEEKGRQRANAISERQNQGTQAGEYLQYPDQPMREPILDEWKNADGAVFVAITRNACGCEVLNTASIMFVDIDLPEPKTPGTIGRWLKRLFGKPEPVQAQNPQETIVDQLRSAVSQDWKRAMRVYRTRSGLRCLLTQTRADPKSEAAIQALEFFGADPLYVRLCKTQECFRARLTPKPWRCDMPPLRVRYPWPDDAAARKVKQWCEEYAAKSQDYATCSLIEQFGNPATDSEIARVVKFHDEATKVGSNLKLA